MLNDNNTSVVAAASTPQVTALSATSPTRRIGFRYSANRPGPTGLITGFGLTVDTLHDTLRALPALESMDGDLFLICLEAVDRMTVDQLQKIAPNKGFDDILFLPARTNGQTSKQSRQHDNNAALRFCLRLGLFPSDHADITALIDEAQG